ncbi:dual specificity protein phosphatase, putative [Cryptosporidium muris RN66]|uniref:protein-tyrosine-phosphatase n=1 Tax=Cryptosporidium muris (strain RN66) TaxID=441375 RepID=B6AAJ7_CRYMR|nr:dual specificity protein phosphatase, putative [Cryptosporidium muris RN66]EEA05238.1 dual specificity protein phosphatase, putative [Cryptosporidium muris RN66]|eukprot:XP_002139587.1 dual specificity protein phosphatase [Cryptosporidium muris RN66]
MDAFRRLIEKRLSRISLIESMNELNQNKQLDPIAIYFYYASLRIVHQLRRKLPEPSINLRVQDILRCLTLLEKCVSEYGALVTSFKEEAITNNNKEYLEETIYKTINELGYKELLNKELEAANQESLDLHKAQRIIPGVYLGGVVVANDMEKLKQYGITHIVSCIPNGCRFPKEFQYLNIPLCDSPFEDISKYFVCSNEFIKDALQNSTVEKPTCVYIHCAAGISRAPTICAAFLIKELKITTQQALKLIKLARPYIAPNPGFLKQLYSYYCLLNSTGHLSNNQLLNTQILSIDSNSISGVKCSTIWKRNIKRKDNNTYQNKSSKTN